MAVPRKELSELIIKSKFIPVSGLSGEFDANDGNNKHHYKYLNATGFTENWRVVQGSGGRYCLKRAAIS